MNTVVESRNVNMQEFLDKKKHLLLDANATAIRSALKKNGYYFKHDFLSSNICSELIKFIDAYELSNISGKAFDGEEVNYGGSEVRIWSSEKKNPLVHAFKGFSDAVYSKVMRTDMAAFNILSIRNKAIDRSNENLTQGRWHIDSFRPQYKLFLFLTDTTEKSGPFEFVPGTHKTLFKYQMLLRGKYISLKDLLKGERTYQSLSDSYIKKRFKSIPAICKQGTLMFVDTSALHRARPCIEGSRYALTSYYK